MIHPSFKEVEDFSKCIDNNYLKVCLLTSRESDKKGFKAPANTYKGDDWVDTDTIIFRTNVNLGICFPERNEETECTICCIDIDGIKNQTDEIFKGSVVLLRNIILEGFEKRGLNPMVVRSQSGGYHIYIWVKHFTGKQHGFKSYIYPSRSVHSFANRKEFEDYPSLVSILGHRMEQKTMEIFTQNTMVVAPGSIFPGGRKYTLLDMGAQKFQDISFYEDGNIEDLIFEILQDNFFKYDPTYTSKASHINVNESDKRELSFDNIKNIADLIFETWPLIDGQKQEASLALGGFLYSRNISQKSIVDLGNYVIDNKPDPKFFKGSDEFERSGGFMTALLHDSVENVEKPKQGLTSLREKFEGKYNTQKFQKILWLNTAPSAHQFYPRDKQASMYPRVTLDFDHKQIRYDVLKKVEETDDEGQSYYREVLQPGNEIVHHMISDLTYIDDISDPRTLTDMEKPIKFNISTPNITNNTHILLNRDELFQKYHKFEGAYHVKNKPIMEFIFMEYELLDLISTEEGSSRPGIYLSKDKKCIRRYIDSPNGLKEYTETQVDNKKLTEAVQLLCKINEVVPWTEDKFGAVVKLAFILPYGFVYKMHKKWVPGIILYGEAGSLKSTIGEMLCQISTPIDVNEDHYITNGNEISTDFRMGRDFARHSYPIVINECLDVFSNQSSTESLKHAIDQKMFRSPGGENGETYFARSPPIITLNDELEVMSTREFARRFVSVNLTMADTYTEQEIFEKLSFLNKDGVQNGRFAELTIIGDFIFNFLNNHMWMFSTDIYSTMELIVEALESETNIKLPWLHVDLMNYIDIEREESENIELNNVLKALRRIFLQNKPLYIQGSEEDLLKGMIGREYSYIQFTKDGNVLIQKPFEFEFSKLSLKTIKIKRVAELLQEAYGDEIQHTLAELPESTRENRVRRRGIVIPWKIFLKIIQVKTVNDLDNIANILKGDKNASP